MDYNNNDRDDLRTDINTPAEKTGYGIGAVILVIVIAVAAYFMFNKKTDTPASAANDAATAVQTVGAKTKDAAAEVPQAAKDAVTAGDQKTTRPNADGSKDKLDQK